MKRSIMAKTVHSCFFKQQIGQFIEKNNLQIEDVIGISSRGDYTTLWYWNKAGTDGIGG
ncbi:MAG TPA: hypothetical protein VKN36_07130 [Eudoraea sp.]|nr:hypothetical protein [Eudoraea sp.]